MDERQQKGLMIAATMKIERKGNEYSVPSQSENVRYTVNVAAKSCTCPDHEKTAKECKHYWATTYFLQREVTTVTESEGVTTTQTVTETVRVSYGQNWAAYNAAQTTEKAEFCRLLADLCGTVEEPEQKMGRPPIPRADRIFSACFKVYSGFSGRRFMTDMREAKANGLVSRAPSYNSIFRVIEDEDMTPILVDLIEKSAAPLAEVESHFAADSTGFGTSNYFRYFTMRWGREVYAREWIKLHAMTGTTTNIVTAVSIKGRDANDSPELPALVDATAKNFTMEEVTADKAYSSKANLAHVAAKGAEPFIPFKYHAKPDAKAAVWHRMWHFYAYKREEFLTHYHRRSNVEATFSAIKRKFGDSVRSKTPVAQVNEVLLKVLAHNVVCLIHSMHELGIKPAF